MQLRVWNRTIRTSVAGDFTVYAILIFGMVVGLYFMGYQSPLLESMASEHTQIEHGNVTLRHTPTDLAHKFINSIIEILKDPKFLMSMVVVLGWGFIAGSGTYYIMTYIMPAMLLLLFVNVIVFPTTFLFDPGIPVPISLFLITFLNLFLMLAIVDFVRGK